MDWSELQTYMEQAKRFRLLTQAEEVELANVVHRGGPDAEAARARFLNANLRLVVSIAPRFKYSQLGLADLVQEGNIGLMKALDKFDPTRGFKFSTYASWWIRQAMARAAQQADEIRLPVYRIEIRNRVNRTERWLDANMERDPTDEEVAKAADISVKELKQVRQLPRVGAFLDAPVGEGDIFMGDLIRDDNAEDAELVTVLLDLHDKRELLFDGLSERERIIFDMRFGEEQASLEEIGDVVGLTRERVRQILVKRGCLLRQRAIDLGLR